MTRRERGRLTGEDGDGDGEGGKDAGDDALDGDDDLGSNRISVEEYEKRHGELAKLRALMFYAEQKRHRIKM